LPVTMQTLDMLLPRITCLTLTQLGRASQ